MGFCAAKGLVLVQLSVLLLSSFTVLGEEIESLKPISHHHGHGHHLHPVAAPAHPPSHQHHHHHHHHQHHHSPSASPVHPPSHAPAHSPSHSPVHPPSHAPAHSPRHSPAHSPRHAPAHSPRQAPVQPPSHPPTHHSPAPSPRHPPVHPPQHPPRSFVAVQGVVYCKSCKYSAVDTLLGASPLHGATVKLQCNNTRNPVVVKAKTDKNGYFFISAPKSVTTHAAHKCKVSLVSSPSASCPKPSDLHSGLRGAALRPEKPFVSQKLPFFLYSVGPFAFGPKMCHQ